MKQAVFSVLYLLEWSLFSFVAAQSVPSNLYDALQWRMIGPHRGGRTVGAVGVPQQPNVFYIGVNNGGVWKTTDFGRTWMPIFDDQPTGSIGDVAVAPSNPNVLYVGSGEGLQRPDLSVGNGMYKSTDAGKTWTHLGLQEGQQIGGLAIDPENENRVFVAVLGHPYGPNTERGVYRTLDGGKTWKKVLYKDENTGAVQVTFDPQNAQIVYADMWAGRQGPWENGAWNGANSGLFKSVDGGETWTQLTKGLPTTAEGLGRIGFCIAPSDPKRLYATVDANAKGGFYRSDDAGASWYLLTNDNRIWGRAADFAECKVHPNNPDVVFSANVVAWKSTDGGKSWTGFRGAPGGDDYHRIWINPNNPDVMLFASDQGAIITVNGGETFSSWYNQPTAQFYHVITDNAFPYNVYGGQQESGSVGIASRGNDGQITFREWHPVGVEEYGYVAPDPLDPNIIYGGKITRFDKRTGQVQNIAPEAVRSGKYRFLRTAPVIFSPIDPKMLFYAGNVLFKTRNGGNSWDIISPDLSRESWDIPESVGIYTDPNLKTMPRRGVIYTIAPSFKDVNTIWVGTDDGLIHRTIDGGKTWKNVTPTAITSWSKISIIEASHFDNRVAYAAVNRIRMDDMKAHIYRTTDGGKTWTEISQGLPDEPINTIREDPKRRGLLFAGSENAVYFSIDDGAHWQSLRLNMPATSIRDLVIKDNDIVVGTHGRSFWILDDVSPLRQIASQSSTQTTLFRPQDVYRVRWSMNTDTPVPQEEPAGQNPPEGAILYYYLKDQAHQVTLEILDTQGRKIRDYSSEDKPYEIPAVNIPHYWIRPQQILSVNTGIHRFMWDLHTQPRGTSPSFPMNAIYQNTAPAPTSPWVLPGNYTARLTVDGKSYTQPIVVKMDPRVKTTLLDLKKQYDISTMAQTQSVNFSNNLIQLRNIRNQIKFLQGQRLSEALQSSLKALDAKLMVFEAGSTTQRSFAQLSGAMGSIYNILQGADVAPTSQLMRDFLEASQQAVQLQNAFDALLSTDVKNLNQQLKASGITTLLQ